MKKKKIIIIIIDCDFRLIRRPKKCLLWAVQSRGKIEMGKMNAQKAVMF